MIEKHVNKFGTEEIQARSLGQGQQKKDSEIMKIMNY